MWSAITRRGGIFGVFVAGFDEEVEENFLCPISSGVDYTERILLTHSCQDD